MTGPDVCNCGYGGPQSHCYLCHLTGAPDVLRHVQSEHPTEWSGVECWPDGEPVVVDTTLEPGDFR